MTVGETTPAAPTGAYKAVIPDESWLALAALTETNLPAEWPWVMQVIINRSRHRGLSIYEVVRQPWQFSAFNGYRQPLDQEMAVFEAVRQALGAGEAVLEAVARLAAGAMLALPPQCSILPAATYTYWSPRSMVPRDSLPPWDWRVLHCFNVPGISPERFVFAQDRPAGAAGTNNSAQYRGGA